MPGPVPLVENAERNKLDKVLTLKGWQGTEAEHKPMAAFTSVLL